MEERVSKEIKLNAAKDIVANYLRSDKHEKMSPDEVCQFLNKVYNAIDEIVPDPGSRRVGLA